jgi:hypothetical protein
MRCKKHTADFSSTVGVCASCLRERLFVLIAAQAEAHQKEAQLPRAESRAALSEDPRKSDPTLPPPPLVFPRSVSPYVARRKSDESTWQHNTSQDRRFYSTPQVGPTYAGANTFATVEACRKKSGRFSLLTKLFRTRSEKIESDPRVSSRESCEPSSSATISSSSSSSPWFTAIFSGSRRKNSRLFVLEEPSAPENRKPRPTADRGMSPVRTADSDNECDRSPSASGYSSESWRSPAFPVRRGRQGHTRNVSGMAFCLSPLVRASPSRHWNQKGLQPDMAVSGEGRDPRKPHLSTAGSFCKNRSRKLADFGRVHHNR